MKFKFFEIIGLSFTFIFFSCISPEIEPDPYADENESTYEISWEINPNVKKHDYIVENFVHNKTLISYENDPRYTYRLGIDISRHDKKVNWKKVKKAGIDFVFLRVGYRGYQTGILHVDEVFHRNIKGARKAGLDVGVYVFSQALNEEEAIEEAELCLRETAPYKLQLPIAYDPESVLWEWARTDDITKEQVTKNTLAFCNRIEEAGFEPIIYSNLNWEVNFFDLEKLSKYRIWYADYRKKPKTPYHFDFWQYGGEFGIVPGIKRKVDVDIQLIPKQTTN